MSRVPIITIDKLHFAYDRAEVLNDLSLTIRKGDFLGLIGHNGSGKSTLLKIILGLLKPKKGRVELFGTAVAEFKDWHKIGYVAQKAGLNPANFPLTVAEVLAMANRSHAGQEVDRVLRLTGIAHQKHKLLSELSGGQQQRVFIARALINHPALLILDEPTVGVDAPSRSKFYELLKKLNQEEQLTIILVSHELDLLKHEVPYARNFAIQLHD